MKTKIFHTANAGLFLSSGNTGVFIDAIHLGGYLGFPSMPQELNEQFEKQTGLFEHPAALLFTHFHGDHCDYKKTAFALDRQKDLAFWGPGIPGSGLEQGRFRRTPEAGGKILCCRGIQDLQQTAAGVRFAIGDFDVFAYRTHHSGEDYKDEPHVSLLFRNRQADEWIFVGGDAVFDPALADVIAADMHSANGDEADGSVSDVAAAFVIILQLHEKTSKEFLRKLDPERILLYHRPDPENKENDFQWLIDMAFQKSPLPGFVIEKPETMDWIK